MRRILFLYCAWCDFVLVIRLLIVCVLCGAPCLMAVAQSVPATRLAVDTVTLDDSKHFRGAVVDNDYARGLTMVVERQWFKETYSKRYAEFIEQESADRETTLKQTLSALPPWIEQRADDAILVAFLKEEQIRIESELAKAAKESKTKFAIVKFPTVDIKNVLRQDTERRLIAAIAWKHGIKNVSKRSVDSLRRELNRKTIDLDGEPVDLSDELPITIQTVAELAARQALVEYNLRGPLEYQGTSEFLMRTTEQAVPIGALMGQFLKGGGSINEMLKELGLPEGRDEVIQESRRRNRDAARRKATGQAEADDFRGLLITRIDQDLSAPVVAVECEFCAMIEPGNWVTVASFVGQARIDEQQAADIDMLKDDPQIKQLLEMMQGLGIGDASMMDRALRYGAATQQATTAAQKQFLSFANRYLDRLDRPPLTLRGNLPTLGK